MHEEKASADGNADNRNPSISYERKRSGIDESNFEPDYEEHMTDDINPSDDQKSKAKSSDDTSKRHQLKPSYGNRKRSRSYSASSSSSSDSNSTDSSSESEDRKRKKRKHKKQKKSKSKKSKKKKKTKK